VIVAITVSGVAAARRASIALVIVPKPFAALPRPLAFVIITITVIGVTPSPCQQMPPEQMPSARAPQ
jgi:hypothetical protein